MNEELKNYFIDLLENCSEEEIDFFLEAASMELDEEGYNEAYQAAFKRYLTEDEQ